MSWPWRRLRRGRGTSTAPAATTAPRASPSSAGREVPPLKPAGSGLPDTSSRRSPRWRNSARPSPYWTSTRSRGSRGSSSGSSWRGTRRPLPHRGRRRGQGRRVRRAGRGWAMQRGYAGRRGTRWSLQRGRGEGAEGRLRWDRAVINGFSEFTE
ncbi:unnamed protein product [Musa acuminata subsp. malaccensis]|uniref:(wild Malaysian banana) hypothetical protein n=1 Tax=Musa acuminata subsp. malaccensis TaxID=214687 RepID=A0A804JD51_MUSAM|nr:unnamed protein product [Musa acuminata subsp. malaccensis]